MTIEGAEPNTVPPDHHILDWLGDSVSFFPSFIDDPYNPGEIEEYPWWDDQQPSHDEIVHGDLVNGSSETTADTTPVATPADPPAATDSFSEEPVSSKKRKAASPLEDQIVKSSSLPPSQPQRKTTSTGGQKKIGGKKRSAASSGKSSGNGNGKEGRWAEQLLNPCAAAIVANNLTRVQHLLYVLNELSSLTGEPNHRLAAHGLHALTHHLSPLSASSTIASPSTVTFSTAEPRFFQKSLLKFNEISPWFAFPSNITNSSILQLLNEGTGNVNPGSNKSRHCSALHILDIGVSHGAQWPILLDALSRRHGGPPPLVRLTVVSPSTTSTDAAPFAAGPPGYDSSPLLLEFAKSLNINLQIHRINEGQLMEKVLTLKPDEMLVVCAQFRLNHFNHNGPNNERSKFLNFLRELNPKGLVLNDNNVYCSCTSCVDYATGFTRRIELLWSFLESTSAAFKGRESEERRMMEGEAAKGLIGKAIMNDGKERWCERLREAGFVAETVGEDVVDGGRALLRKHDGNWEMRVDEEEGRERKDGNGSSGRCGGNVVSLWWKGQPVSFCSLWKLGNSNS
ncbi:hypothetical protein MLD38_037527 [Melastoma candidum]|uniref:Uncharacterized protein n=1 Tax=Melastoma candidum TaxID=119954 RepID=A0ACB9LP06_9MYRT|nr:hypothetical protein MLD38_037527 [Melastoma candidum]